MIRVPVNGIRIASRATKGVTIFNTAEGEKVVSVERISEPNGGEGQETQGAAPEGLASHDAADHDAGDAASGNPEGGE